MAPVAYALIGIVAFVILGAAVLWRMGRATEHKPMATRRRFDGDTERFIRHCEAIAHRPPLAGIDTETVEG